MANVKERIEYEPIIADILLELGYGPTLLDGIDPQSLLELIREHRLADV